MYRKTDEEEIAMSTTAAPTGPLEYKLPIEGMTCANCVSGIEKALQTLPGVESTTVNLPTGEATVPASTNVDVGALANAVRKAGSIQGA
ncbi:heavy-metal-associated domain-containing protein [Paraburkholderia ribeironis]|uniref:heavy-metal-associated domain-containing protein n=1 Tax=Paraburkholderia ribeironis TaxID=1247936 RepID=UPI000B9D530B|nr:heavy metal-associated domain-containing protein [Paraburkholderia ribeironis]